MSHYLNNDRLKKAVVHLTKKDKDLARIFQSDGVPPLWARRPGFNTLIKIILEQQVSLASAKAVYKRVTDSINPLSSEHIEELGDTYLRELGVTRQKSSYIINIAKALISGELDLKSFNKLDDDSVRENLMNIKGIGSWTADIYLLMALRRPDIWPSGDVAIEKTVRKFKRLRHNSTSKRISKVAEQWRPFRSVAARMLWHHYLTNNLRNS
ncbi:MAG: DNA-3-methyladenine glycosylase 2 family protein [Ignavibacterium sp.]|nr:MAG: DNA-3-methyladenine glycosylase 2 family protein [Ignavibacterium sp.]